MLSIVIPGFETFDDSTQTFGQQEGVTLKLEHSLVSVSKWESSLKKPFLDNKEKTDQDVIEYIKCMTLNPEEVEPHHYTRLSAENFSAINEYINDKATATWFNDRQQEGAARFSREIVTAELIYYWMVALTIPKEMETWHLNRLMTLIKVANEKNKPQKKMSPQQIMARNKQLNAQRQQAMGSSG